MNDTVLKDEAALLREKGKLLFFYSDGAQNSKDEGIGLLNQAARLGDAESLYILGTEMLRGTLRPHSGDRIECAYDYLLSAARAGSAAARGILNSLCLDRYNSSFHHQSSDPRPLTDFDGNEIQIDCKGFFVPVDARLSFDGEANTLLLSANIHFVFSGNEDFDIDLYTESILRGFRDWEGEYEVFGGQKLKVAMELTAEDRIKDSVHVIPLSGELRAHLLSASAKLGGTDRGRKMEEVVSHRRSFAGIGFGKWSVHSMKVICMQSRTGRFDDPNELRDTARHEFGHVLGLGDLYASETDGLEGVEPAAYDEVDCFRLFGRTYHLVMCDPTAPVSNNDIEMVLLAFSRNRFQRFQKDSTGNQLSEALGKGN